MTISVKSSSMMSVPRSQVLEAWQGLGNCRALSAVWSDGQVRGNGGHRPAGL